MFNKYTDIRSVLFIRFGAIGDVVHTTAAYQSIQKNIKNARIDYLTSSLIQELLNNDNTLRQVISLNDHSLEGMFRLANNLSDNHYDLVVNLQPSLKTHLFTMVLNKRFVLTYKKFKPKKGEKHIHAVENFFNTIKPVIPEAETPKQLKIYLNNEVVKWAKYRLDSEKITHTIGIVPGVSQARRGRIWPKEYWKIFLDYVANKKQLNVIIFGGTDEIELATELQDVNKNKIRNFCGKLSISQTAGILSLCMLVVGCDTGPTHIASAVGPKVIGLYGSTHPNRTGLYGIGHEILYSSHDCIACEKRSCAFMNESNPYAPCMQALSPDMVIKALGI